MVSKTIKATVGQKIAYKIIKDGFKTENGTIDVTSDMDTNVSLETPSTPYTSNIDYSIVENDAFPSIFKLNEDVVLPDDSVLEKNDYLLYPKGEYLVTDDSNEMVYENNFIVNGSVKNIGYTFSNFSSSNYLTLNGLFNPGSNVWETVIKINTTNLSSGGNCWLMGSNTSSNLSWLIGLLTTNSPYSRVYLSSNGSSWDIASGVDGSHQYALYTDYWLKFEFTGNQYILSYSTDGQNFIQDIVINSSTPISNNQPIQIGNNEQHNAYFPGTVDLSETYIKIDGEIWWKPQVANVSYNYNINGTCALVRDGVAKGFNTENYLRLNPMPVATTTLVDLIFKGMTTDLNSHNTLIANTSSEQLFAIRYNNNKSFSLYNNGWVDGVNTLSTNVWYWFRVTFDGTTWTGYTLEDKNYTKETLPEISEWRQEWATSSLYLTGNVFNIGFNPFTTGEYWKGSIDLSQSSITLDNELWWNGTNHQQIGYWDANGVTKGFSTSNYLTLSTAFKPTGDWEIVLKFQMNESVSREQGLFGYNGTGLFKICLGGNNRMILSLSTVDNDWNIGEITGTTDIELNKFYWVKAEFNGNIYKLSLSDNGIDYNLEGTLETSSIPVFPDTTYLGVVNHNYNSLAGSIDLNESYINIDGKLWWQGISKNKFKKSNIKMIGSPNIDMNGVVSNFSDYNYIQFPHVVNNETEIFTTFTTGTDISNMANILTFIGAGEIYIRDSVLQTWNIETGTDMTLTSMLPNTMYSLRMKMNPNGRTITIYDADNTIIVEQTINDSGATFNNTSIINFGFYNANSSFRYWKGSIDLANTYVIIDDVKYNLLENDGRYLQGIFDESFVDNYNQEQSVKLYNTVSSNTNALTITNDNVTDGLYSQYIDNITIPSREKQFTYNIDDKVWEEI